MAERKAKNIILLKGRTGIKSDNLSGVQINIDLDNEKQQAGFYHPNAALIIRNYKGSYKQVVKKGNKTKV